jgi:hypothetical protein
MTAAAKRRDGPNTIYLQPAAKTSDCSRPLLLADGPAVANITSDEDESTGDAVEWPEAGFATALQAVYCRLLGPFTDVVCLFLSDFPGMPDLANFISAWIHASPGSPSLLLPRLVIVTQETGGNTVEWESSFFRELCKKADRPFNTAFAGLSVCPLGPGETILDRARCKKLEGFLLNECDFVASCRTWRHLNFHGRHVAALFDQAYACFLKKSDFDYIIASRVSDPIPHGAARQVSYFLRDFTEQEALRSCALPVVASAFMLDAFPPGMHGQF